jgi:NADPH-dependent glutamate synthase beta subunit-like oxidoreductase/NAD(P)H-flavin reductase
MTFQHKDFALGISDFTFNDLHNYEGLKRLDHRFREMFKEQNPELFSRFQAHTQHNTTLGVVEKSRLLTDSSKLLSSFLTQLFYTKKEAKELENKALASKTIFEFKKSFMLKRYHKKFNTEGSNSWDFEALDKNIHSHVPEVNEKTVAWYGLKLLKMEKEDHELVEKDIQNLLRWIYKAKEKGLLKDWVSPHKPSKTNFSMLVEQEEIIEENGLKAYAGVKEHLRNRDGFKLTDKRMSSLEIDAEVDYCLRCHEKDQDSCNKGMIDKKSKKIKKNKLGISMDGCPLDVKVSEFQEARHRGDPVGALALIMVDNPMLPGTGHRICNDCMRGCIYQNQDPVNTPQAETACLMETLNLKFGFEIYSLLLKWNPLDIDCPIEKPYNGKNVLVVGMGPAGYTLTHYLLRQGFGVIGIDGLKIEPLEPNLTGMPSDAGHPHHLPTPLKHIDDILMPTDERITVGFGGVSEYGITVRWDKNFLNIIYLAISRRRNVSIHGGIRFGGTLDLDDAWKLGFHHVAMATGAGKPTFINMENNLARGVGKASDFLMALQLSGAAKKETLVNLQVRLPAAVIGGGLTAVDTATEVAAYYPIQVEKAYLKHKTLLENYSQEKFDSIFAEEEQGHLKMFIEHGRIIAEERQRALQADEEPNFIQYVQKWGGVRVFYRKRMIDSPAYRLNAEEVTKALEEGIYFVEKMNPIKAMEDKYGALNAVEFEFMEINEDGKWSSTGERKEVPTCALYIAAGTKPNTVYEKERPGSIEMDKWKQFYKKFQSQNSENEIVLEEESNDEIGFFTSYQKDGRCVSFYGDNHPDYAGNVVKAMASAKDGYKKVVSHLMGNEYLDHSNVAKGTDIQLQNEFDEFKDMITYELTAQVVEVKRLTPKITELIVKAPLAAKKFEPGQFYRLQNLESYAPMKLGTRLTLEGIALTGAWVDKKKGLLSTIVLEMGTSSRLVSTLLPNEKVVLMGPTGTATEIPENETILLLGGGLGNAVLFSISKAMKERGNKVIYVAGYKEREDVFKMEEVESSTDLVIWSVDSGDSIPTRRPQDKSFTGNIIQALHAYNNGELGEISIPLINVDRMIAIGSDRMMAAVQEHRQSSLKGIIKDDVIAIGSINSPMQCMMKEICAQCVCKHIDPKTGKESYVFSCFNQDQPLDHVDFKNLNQRLKSNSTLEKLSNMWLSYILEHEKVAMV